MSTLPSTTVRPSYITPENANLGAEEFGKYIKPPRLKIVQPTSRAPLSEKFSPGDAVLVPRMELIAPKGKAFQFTPVFFFPEWCTWNPLAAPGLDTIRARSFDPNSDIAIKCRDKSTRQEPCPEMPGAVITHQEHLNLAVILHGLEGMEETPVILTFVRGEYATGALLMDMIRARRAPIMSTIFEGKVPTQIKSNEKGQWYGFSFDNPAENAWVAEDVFPRYLSLHNMLKEAHASASLIVDHDDSGTADSSAGTVDAGTGKESKSF